ncbi:HalOD1 output domain-containing protein [Halosolutus halophilus]|uniref:HalOD1 output domain-containing protein n=1 Tax=Halosolutus halophilus TaxID=1552990 RepID=UPI0022351EB1|nr:HalOD1 output domain-containing protein [Halosolutus halophilus]
MVPPDHNCPRNGGREEIRVVRGESESVIQTIVRGLAGIKGVPVSELDPLYDRVETEAMAALLSHARRADGAVGIEFTIDGYTVSLSNDGKVCIHDGTPVVAPSR